MADSSGSVNAGITGMLFPAISEDNEQEYKYQCNEHHDEQRFKTVLSSDPPEIPHLP